MSHYSICLSINNKKQKVIVQYWYYDKTTIKLDKDVTYKGLPFYEPRLCHIQSLFHKTLILLIN